MPVYFVQAGADGPIKIGFATDVRRRLTNMQTASAAELRLLAAIEGDQDHEAALHARLAPLRVRGEWFRDDPVLRAVMADGRPVTLTAAPRAPLSKLDEYMERAGLSDDDMARLVRRSQSRISRVRRRLENPSLELAIEIDRVTGGEVRPEDLFVPPQSGEATA